MSNEILIGIIGFISTIVSGFTSWFFTRKKQNAETDSTLIENMTKTLDFYKQVCDDNAERLERLLAVNEALEAEVASLKEQVIALTNQIREYELRILPNELDVETKPKKK